MRVKGLAPARTVVASAAALTALTVLSACSSTQVSVEEVAPLPARTQANMETSEAPSAQDVDTSTIAASPAVEMVIPRIELTAAFEEGSCRTVDGAIDPESITEACTYTPEDRPYELPASDASDIVVIAGHAGAGVAAVFDKLYDVSADAHSVAVNDRMFLKTESSGDRYLVYQVTDLHSPQKDTLSTDDAVWGTEATPGRLLTISCIQPQNVFAESVRNVVVGWQFLGFADEATEGAPVAQANETAEPAPQTGVESPDGAAREVDRAPFANSQPYPGRRAPQAPPTDANQAPAGQARDAESLVLDRVTEIQR